jgi:hypothetical protein
MKKMLMSAVVMMALGSVTGVCQTNTEQTTMTKSQLKQQEKANKAQAKADKAQRKALNTKEQKRADKAQDKANREVEKIPPQ